MEATALAKLAYPAIEKQIDAVRDKEDYGGSCKSRFGI